MKTRVIFTASDTLKNVKSYISIGNSMLQLYKIIIFSSFAKNNISFSTSFDFSNHFMELKPRTKEKLLDLF